MTPRFSQDTHVDHKTEAWGIYKTNQFRMRITLAMDKSLQGGSIVYCVGASCKTRRGIGMASTTNSQVTNVLPVMVQLIALIQGSNIAGQEVVRKIILCTGIDRFM